MRNKLTDGAAHIEIAEAVRRCRLCVLPERQKLRQVALLGGFGFWFIQYRLKKGKVAWQKENNTAEITYKQMEWLLDGLDIEQKHYVGEVKERLLT